MSSRGDFFAGLIIGGLIGAGIALLFAPQSGEETRAFLKEKALELKEKAEHLPEVIKRETKDLLHKGKDLLEEKKAELKES